MQPRMAELFGSIIKVKSNVPFIPTLASWNHFASVL